MAKQKVDNINKLNMADFFEKTKVAVSGVDLCKEFNAKANLQVPMHYNEFQALVSRDLGYATETDDQGYAAFKIKLKAKIEIPVIVSAEEEEEEDED